MVQNCWELKNCGRELRGKNSHLGVCPAYSEKKYNGINRGTNSGRLCWFVSGTFCKGEIQGSHAQKRLTCLSCEFYKQVKLEEGDNFILTMLDLDLYN